MGECFLYGKKSSNSSSSSIQINDSIEITGEFIQPINEGDLVHYHQKHNYNIINEKIISNIIPGGYISSEPRYSDITLDGKFGCIGNATQIILFRIHDNKQVTIIPIPDIATTNLRYCKFNKEGDYLVVGSANSTGRLRFFKLNKNNNSCTEIPITNGTIQTSGTTFIEFTNVENELVVGIDNPPYFYRYTIDKVNNTATLINRSNNNMLVGSVTRACVNNVNGDLYVLKNNRTYNDYGINLFSKNESGEYFKVNQFNTDLEISDVSDFYILCSPNGKYVVVATRATIRDSQYNIYVYSVNGQNLTRIYESDTRINIIYSIKFNVDGSKLILAYSSNRYQTFTFNNDTGIITEDPPSANLFNNTAFFMYNNYITNEVYQVTQSSPYLRILRTESIPNQYYFLKNPYRSYSVNSLGLSLTTTDSPNQQGSIRTIPIIKETS